MKFFLLFAALLLTGAAATPVPSVSGAVTVVMADIQSPSVASLDYGWAQPTLNTDGSAITTSLTYSVYVGVAGSAPTLMQSGITALDYSFTTSLPSGVPICFAFTATENGTESAQSPQACITAPYVPNAPTNFQVT